VAEVGRTVKNTIAKTPITFAMIELADPSDCNSRRSGWLNYGFKDVTPKFASQSQVPSLNDSQVAPGRKMLELMASVNADWYMLSGHQGALYAHDYFLFNGADGNMDPVRLVNEEEFCGFFNESYHEGRWMHSKRTDPDATTKESPDAHPGADKETPEKDVAAHRANELYLRCTPPAPKDMALHTQNNPYLDGVTSTTMVERLGRCKGLILSACNTLIYLSNRATWSAFFPNSVIFGTYSRIANGVWVTNSIASAAMTDENFWRDPPSVLDQTGNCEKLATQLMSNYAGTDRAGICFIYKGTLYLPLRDKKNRKIEVKVQPAANPFTKT
jgi:hypothetical protein